MQIPACPTCINMHMKSSTTYVTRFFYIQNMVTCLPAQTTQVLNEAQHNTRPSPPYTEDTVKFVLRVSLCICAARGVSIFSVRTPSSTGQ